MYQKIYARRWSFFFRADYRYRRLWFRELFEKQGIRPEGKRVLDVGFGSGTLLFSLPRSTGLYGVEQAESAIENADREAEALGYREFEFKKFTGQGNLPFDDNRFDYVFCVHVLEHVEDDRHLIEEMRRVLKPDGLLFLVLPVEQEGENPRHLRVYRSEGVRQLIEGSFDLVGEEGSYHHARFLLPMVRVHTKRQVPVLGTICDILHHLLLRFLPYRAGRFLDRWLDSRGIEPSQRLYLCRAPARAAAVSRAVGL